MNRRSFFKTVTGFIAGMFTLPSLAKEKPKLTVAMLKKCKDEIDAKKVSDDFLIPVGFDSQKFHTGDRVRIADELPITMSHFLGAGKNATIDYSYDDKFRVKDPPSKRPQYALEIDGLRWSAWYPEYLLKKI